MRSTTRTNRWFVLLFVFALFATACGGEVDDAGGPDDTDDSDTTEEADGNDTTEGDGNDTTEGDGDGDGDEPDDAEPLPNVYDDPRGGIFVDFQRRSTEATPLHPDQHLLHRHR